MNWKIIFLFTFTLAQITSLHAESKGKQAVLHLRGVVPLRAGIGLIRNQAGNMIPTLRTNAPANSPQTIRVKSIKPSRSIASTDDHYVVVESN